MTYERRAAIDIGTVTTRLLVADVSDTEVREVIRRSAITHLGEGWTTTGTLSEAGMARVEAAIASGAGPSRIILRHLVPNLAGTVVVYATLMIPQMILVESFLSFLGIGIQEPLASLGNLIADGAAEMEAAPWILLAPAGCLVVIVFCFNFLGDGLRDALDPRER